MNGRTHFFLIFATCLLLCQGPRAFSQEKCGTVQLEEKYRPLLGESAQGFESWVHSRLEQRRLNFASGRIAETVYTIPVVVHILHQGEAYGEESNIPIEQVFSQIELLNQDFRRLNADAADTREQFVPVAADVQIEFVLAKTDPEGLPTEGIVRTRAGRDSYAIGEEEELRKVSYWPSEEYLNIWVTTLRSGLLGFAQFPVSDLVGLQENTSNKFLPDGVTIDYEYFGEGYNAADFSKGRTATHEIGHYFGLRHIWGDGGCGADDFCEDTPPQDGPASSASCQLTRASCNTLDMIENFMDYSPDVCMNIFTLNQKERMRTVLENSPRRLSLLTSNGALAPISVANDLGIREITNPLGGICNARFIPEVVVRNYGTNTITQFEIAVVINGVEWDSRTIAASLPPLATYTVTFDEVLLEQSGIYNTSFNILNVNSALDGNPSNNNKSVAATYQRLITLPFLETFEDAELQLLSKTDNQDKPFAFIQTTPKEVADNLAMKFDYAGSDSTQFGSWEMLLSPIIDLTKYPSFTIDFDYAYGHDGANNADGLIVALSGDCGTTIDPDNIVFRRFGANLATTNIEPEEDFIPSGPAEWRKASITVNNFRDSDRVQVIFIAQNGLGNSLFLDDIRISSNNLADYDIGITELKNLPFVSCINRPVASVEVRNFGRLPVANFTLTYARGEISQQVLVSNLFLNTGQSVEIPLELGELEDGPYTLSLSVSQPNGSTDQRTSDNSLSKLFHVRTSTETIPFRETFASSRTGEEDFLHRLINEDGRTWQLQNDESLGAGNRVVRMTSFDLTALGDEFWLATKVLDLDNAREASMSFKLSYAKRANRSERLRVMVSGDCGITFGDIVYDKRGSDLAITDSETFWTPESADDWRTESIDLSAYAGKSNVVVTLVATNGNGNNMYLDDIEFYLSSEPTPPLLTNDLILVYPNPAKGIINIAFDLPQRQTVIVRLQDVRGRIFFEKEYPNTLNQVYQLTTINENNGLYIIQVITPSRVTAQRVIIRH